MADQKALKALLHSKEAWLRFRTKFGQGMIDLTGANLAGLDLSGYDLHDVNLSGGSLENANLEGANLCGARLFGTCLTGIRTNNTDLRETELFETTHKPPKSVTPFHFAQVFKAATGMPFHEFVRRQKNEDS